MLCLVPPESANYDLLDRWSTPLTRPHSPMNWLQRLPHTKYGLMCFSVPRRSDFNNKYIRLPKLMKSTAKRMVNPTPTQRPKRFCKSVNYLMFSRLKAHHCNCRIGLVYLVPSLTTSSRRKGCDCLALIELPSHSHYVPFSLILLTNRRPSTTVNIHIPSLLPRERNAQIKFVANQQLHEVSSDDYWE